MVVASGAVGNGGADGGRRERLARLIISASGATTARVLNMTPLRGGAIQENWAVDVELSGLPSYSSLGSRETLVLRTDAPSRVAVSHGRAEEFRLLRLARDAGVTVPEPLWLCTDKAILGRDFYMMRRVPGVAAGHRIVREPGLGGSRDRLAERLGRELARIHSITPESANAPKFLALPRLSPAFDHVARYRRYLDEQDASYPVLEWGLRWLELNAPPAGEIVLVHQDFRTGNYLVDETGLTAILDWEFCAWGDPMADIGWFCAKCWRFGAIDKEAGGIAPRAPFYRGYEAASGRRIDPVAVHYWEVMAHVRWAVIALQQAERHIAGGEPSLELALTGRILPELELEILDLIEKAQGWAA
ncbi:phosphotransferase family protein [Rhodospirillaceae bacterium SYSU D60014]|uniref:phosphotransferase family protein n=1 Tax=Virgifigura deserti TaxID=2268457 RepID=UPI0013C4AAED